MTAERKKEKHTYYRCTGFRGKCGNADIREERLVDLLGGVVELIQIPAEWADWIANGLRVTENDLEHTRQQALAQTTLLDSILSNCTLRSRNSLSHLR